MKIDFKDSEVGIAETIYRCCDIFRLAGETGLSKDELFLCAIAQEYLPLPHKYEPHFELKLPDTKKMIERSMKKFGWEIKTGAK